MTRPASYAKYFCVILGNCEAKAKAVEWYRKGIDELRKGIHIVCDEEGINPKLHVIK